MGLGGSNAEKWGDHRKKNFFISNSVEALILLKGGHQSLETACTFWGKGTPENCRNNFLSLHRVDQLARIAKP